MRAGAVRIAERGAELAGRPAHVAPLTWFIRFREDATPGLQRELDYVESRLGVHAPRLAGPAQRLGHLYDTLIERQADAFGLATRSHARTDSPTASSAASRTRCSG